jgi:putative endonuclease
LDKLKARFAGKEKPEHLRRGELGERAAKKYLQKSGLKFLAANFRSKRGEIDLIFRDGDCLKYFPLRATNRKQTNLFS